MSGFWSRNRKVGGALLLEVLLSVVILSVSLTLMIQGIVSSLRSVVTSADYTTALILLENEMFDLTRRGSVKAGWEKEGAFSEPYEKYRYELHAGLPADGEEDNLIKTSARLLWASGRRNNRISLETFLFADSL